MTEQGLIYRSGGRLQAVALGHVIEIMRPLPIEAAEDGSQLIMGTSLIRGEPIAVIDLAAFSGTRGAAPRRMLNLRAGKQRFALLADEVLGVRAFPREQERLLGELEGDLAKAMNALDAELRIVLQDLRALPETFAEDQTLA